MKQIKTYLLIFFFLILNNHIKADDIRDFEIDEMSIGDSLLKYFSKTKITNALKNVIYYPGSKKMKIILLLPEINSSYEAYDFHILDNDPNYKIQSVKGRLKISLNECLKKKKVVVNELEKIFYGVKKNEYENYYNYTYGNSKAYLTDFNLNDGSVRVWCANWDKNDKTVIKNNWYDTLNVSISSKNYLYFIDNEAY
tara:strand:+ start:243 stop:833 length:591 start_codon:yes stop_codon:yes gene_type:complete